MKHTAQRFWAKLFTNKTTTVDEEKVAQLIQTSPQPPLPLLATFVASSPLKLLDKQLQLKKKKRPKIIATNSYITKTSKLTYQYFPSINELNNALYHKRMNEYFSYFKHYGQLEVIRQLSNEKKQVVLRYFYHHFKSEIVDQQPENDDKRIELWYILGHEEIFPYWASIDLSTALNITLAHQNPLLLNHLIKFGHLTIERETIHYAIEQLSPFLMFHDLLFLAPLLKAYGIEVHRDLNYSGVMQEIIEKRINEKKINIFDESKNTVVSK
jgi:hypothetical protein